MRGVVRGVCGVCGGGGGSACLVLYLVGGIVAEPRPPGTVGSLGFVWARERTAVERLDLCSVSVLAWPLLLLLLLCAGEF